MSILLVITSKLNLNSSLSWSLFSLISPILTPLNYVHTKEFELIDFLTSLPAIRAENDSLRQDNGLLKIKIKQLNQLIANQNLVGSLLEKKTWRIQPLRLVNAGTQIVFTGDNLENIKVGAPVVAGDSLLGLVLSVTGPIVKVMPLNHPDIRVAAQLETGVKGDYVYKNNFPHIVNLPTDIAFNSKTIVLTLPTEQIPEDLIIGQVERLTTNPANPTQEATLTLNQEINSAKNFFVITHP